MMKKVLHISPPSCVQVAKSNGQKSLFPSFPSFLPLLTPSLSNRHRARPSHRRFLPHSDFKNILDSTRSVGLLLPFSPSEAAEKLEGVSNSKILRKVVLGEEAGEEGEVDHDEFQDPYALWGLTMGLWDRGLELELDVCSFCYIIRIILF